LKKERLLRSSILAGVTALSMGAAPVFAQDAAQTTDQNNEEAEETSSDRIIVTGSRIAQNEFSSASPVQVINSEAARDIGLISPDVILQDATVTAGAQIDGSFAGFVLDNGPGSSTVNLRGLGSDRTLVLVNGRRLAPSGVEGAPSSPSINLLPGTVVDRYELLLDGASSVYGSDAVAGVVNVILQKDFDGLEVNAFHSRGEQSGGEVSTISAKWGINSDRGFSGFAIEYRLNEEMRRRDRDWSSECLRDVEIDENGQIRTTFLSDNASNPLQPTTNCARPRLVGRVSVPEFGSIYYDPINQNSFIPGFSESNFLSSGGTSIGVDSDGDGINDVLFADYTQNGNQEWLDSEVLPRQETLSMFAYGEYETDLLGGTTFFYEALYNNLEFTTNSVGTNGGGQLFPEVSADNPYNICNPNGFGVDCGLAFDQFFLSDAYSNVFQSIVGQPSSNFTQFLVGPLGPQAVTPIIRVRGDRNITTVDLTQTRFVAGLRGDLPFLNLGPVRNWTYEASMAYSRSNGDSNRPGVREDMLNYSLSTSAIDPSTGNVVCGEDTNGDGIPDGIDLAGNACVPVNLFAPSLYNGGEAGDFATQAERDYVFGNRSFNTVYEQTVVNAIFTGDVFELPAGTVGAALGIEYREDVIQSNPSDVADKGLLFGFFQDGGASGSKDLFEVFGEVQVPLFADQPFAYEANINLSARYTDEEFYGEAWTWAVKGDYRPVEWLLLRGTAGTSFRAPNVREQFLRSQSGFNNGLADPCLVPESAFVGDPLDPGSAAYDPSADGRDPQTLENCRLAGLDPTTFGAEDGTPSATGTVSAEVISGGTTGIDPEESESFSAGFVAEQPIFDQFDLTFSATWWALEIEDALVEPSSQFIVNDCYITQPGQTSAFCSRIQRGADGNIDVVTAAPINLNSEKRSGIDFNILFEDEYAIFERNVEVALDLRATHLLEAETTLIDDLGRPDIDDQLGNFGFNEWNGQATLRASVQDLTLTWNTRYLGEATQFLEGVDDFSDAIAGGSSTCLGPDNGDVQCRDYAEADAYFRHDISARYSADTWDLTVGIRNLFDEQPPLVNNSEATANVNAPVGVGYDLNGRTFFASVGRRF